MNINNNQNKSKTQFYIARHGETEWNKMRRLQGRLDSNLTQNGKLQAQQIAAQLCNKNIELIISSPLGRAHKTAQIVSADISRNIITDALLVERHFGDWQGCLFDDLTQQANFHQIFKQVTEHCPPFGETGLDCAQRMSKQLKVIAQDYQQETILIITHGDAIRCLLSDISQNVAVDAYSQYGNGKIFNLVFDHQAQQLVANH
jgi:broad specificity phosphatase PhoE